jgi:hypothetical protein
MNVMMMLFGKTAISIVGNISKIQDICWFFLKETLFLAQPFIYTTLGTWSYTFCSISYHQLDHLSHLPCSSHQLELLLEKELFLSLTPILWNFLSTEIRLSPSILTFQKKLKTYLFTLAFPPLFYSPFSGLSTRI